jgi:hypothetical protein
MAMVSGRVTGPDGGGVAGVYVYAIPASGRRFGRAPGVHTGPTGRWSLRLTPGRWTVRETGGVNHDITVDQLPVDLAKPTSIASTATFSTNPSPRLGEDPVARLAARRSAARNNTGGDGPGREWGPTPEVAERRRARGNHESASEPDVPAATQEAVDRLMSRRREVQRRARDF